MTSDSARLRWRCRRGMRELDQLLGWWFDVRYPHAADAERNAFCALLDAQDPQLWDWFCGRGAPHDPAQGRIVDEIRNRNRV